MVKTDANIDIKKLYEQALLTIESLQQTNQTLQQNNQDLQLTIKGLQLEMLLMRKMIFGSRHEKFQSEPPSVAPTLFDVPPIAIAEVITTTVVTQKERTTTRLQPNHKGRNGLPEHLRREIKIVTPAGIDLANAKKIGEDFSETLAYQPGELFVKKVIRPKFLDAATARIFQAPAPERTFEKSSFDESLAAQIAVEKYVDHLPLHRQLGRYARLGVPISDSTIGDCVSSAAKVTLPLYEAHKQLVLSSGYLHVDETTLKVIDKQKKGTTHLGYYWVYQSHVEKLVLFDYQTGRGREGPQSMLKNYQGYLQTDGYAV